MVDYQQGKIYKVHSINGDKCYIGSTTKDLKDRFLGHKRHFKSNKNYISCFDIFNLYGVDNCEISLLENYPCNNKHELFLKEGEYIRNTNCVNYNISGRCTKDYVQDNREYFKEKRKEWENRNRLHLSNYMRDYKNNNKIKIDNYMEQYVINNNDKLTQLINCECGGKYQYKHKTCHFKTNKHKNYFMN